MLHSLPLLGLLLVFAVFDALHAALSWVAQGTDEQRAMHYRRVLLFDAAIVGLFGVVLLVGVLS